MKADAINTSGSHAVRRTRDGQRHTQDVLLLQPLAHVANEGAETV